MERRWVRVSELARMLGLKEKSLYPHVRAGRLPVLRLGRAIYIDTARLGAEWRPPEQAAERERTAA